MTPMPKVSVRYYASLRAPTYARSVSLTYAAPAVTVINYDVLGISGKGTVLIESLDLKETIVASKVPTSLLGDWLFIEGEGSTLRDYSGNNINGTIYGAVWVEKDSVMTLYFDGVDDYVDFGDVDALEFRGTQPFSIEAVLWIHPDSTNCHIISKEGRDANGVQGWQVGVLGTHIRLIRWRDSTFNICSFEVPFATWVHVVFTYDGARMKGYLNGTLKATATSTLELVGTTDPFTIGRRPYGGYHFKGYIALARAYTKTLTDTEVQSLYEAVAKVLPLG